MWLMISYGVTENWRKTDENNCLTSERKILQKIWRRIKSESEDEDETNRVGAIVWKGEYIRNYREEKATMSWVYIYSC